MPASLTTNALIDAIDGKLENVTTEVTVVSPQRDAHGRLAKGHTANPGGRPKALIEVQRMLDEEHRNLPAMRETFARLRNFALGEAVVVPVLASDGTSIELKAEIKADARFMALYLAYTVGPPKAPDQGNLIEELQKVLADAPPEVMQYILTALAGRGR